MRTAEQLRREAAVLRRAADREAAIGYAALAAQLHARAHAAEIDAWLIERGVGRATASCSPITSNKQSAQGE
jgi:hypothetical protein